MNALQALAFKILEQWIDENYLHRSHVHHYTRWMCNDYPVFEDMEQHFQKCKGTKAPDIEHHRKQMREKYQDWWIIVEFAHPDGFTKSKCDYFRFGKMPKPLELSDLLNEYNKKLSQEDYYRLMLGNLNQRTWHLGQNRTLTIKVEQRGILR